MPTYQYACTECDERLEVVQSFTDAALTDCPACRGRLRKVFSAVGVVFKGSGFYKTDSRPGEKSSSDRAGDKAGAEKPASSDKGSSGGGSSDKGSSGGGSSDKGSSGGGSSGAPAAASSASSSTPAAKSA